MLRAQSCHMLGDLAGAESAGRRAVALEAGGIARWRAAALALLGVSLFWRGRAAEASVLFEQVANPTRPPASNLASVWALGCLAAISAREGDLESCERRLREATAFTISHDLGGYWITATAVTTSADLLAGRGQLAEAEEEALHALELARRGRAHLESAQALLCLARIRSHAGDISDARARIGEARAIIARCTDPGILGGLLAETEQAAAPQRLTPGLGPRGHARRPGGLTAREAEPRLAGLVSRPAGRRG